MEGGQPVVSKYVSFIQSTDGGHFEIRPWRRTIFRAQRRADQPCRGKTRGNPCLISSKNDTLKAGTIYTVTPVGDWAGDSQAEMAVQSKRIESG